MTYKLKVRFYSKTPPEQLVDDLQAAYDNNAVAGTFVIEKTADAGFLQVTFDRDTQDDVEYIASRAVTALGAPQNITGVAILAAAVEQLKLELTLWETSPAVGEVVKAMGHLGAVSLDNFDELLLACRETARDLEAYRVTYTKDVPCYGSHTIFAPKGADHFTLGRLAQKIEQEGEVSYEPKWEETGPTRIYEALGPDGKAVAELEDMPTAGGNPTAAAQYGQFVEMVAKMSKDREILANGKVFDLAGDDAVDTLHGLISAARSLTGAEDPPREGDDDEAREETSDLPKGMRF